MKPVITPYTNTTFVLPGGDESNQLPVEKAKHENDGQPVLISTWELTGPEMLALRKSRKIDLIVWGTGHPPVAMRVNEDGDALNPVSESAPRGGVLC